MKELPNKLMLVTLLVVASYSKVSIAGVFTGYELDEEDSTFTYIGSQSENKVFFHFFAGNLVYEFLNSRVSNGVGVNQLIKSDSRMLTLGIGYRLGKNQNYAIIVGPTQSENIETTDNVSVATRSPVGGFLQLSAGSYTGKVNSEFIVSYSEVDKFTWGRLRLKYKLSSWFSFGIEAFGMGNKNADSYGGGMLIGVQQKSISIGIKFGRKQTTTDVPSVYSGVEFYFPF